MTKRLSMTKVLLVGGAVGGGILLVNEFIKRQALISAQTQQQLQAAAAAGVPQSQLVTMLQADPGFASWQTKISSQAGKLEDKTKKVTDKIFGLLKQFGLA